MIALLRLDLARIDAARGDPSQVDGIPVVDGGLPPAFIVDQARAALLEGKPELWFTPQLFAAADPQRIVGSGIFKGAPDAGWVEIGYGVAESCRSRGHATDAVFALVRLAFDQPGIRAVYAETAVANVASRRVVEKVGFTWAGRRDSDDDGEVDCWFVEAPTVSGTL